MKKRLSTLVVAMVVSLVLVTGAWAAGPESVSGVVSVVDQYGNITLDVLTQELLDAGYEFGDLLTIRLVDREFQAPFVTAYSDVEVGKELVRGPGGDGSRAVIVATNMGDFATAFGVAEGDAVTIELAEKSAYLAEWLIRQIKRTNEREDYASDAIFANFRLVTTGNMGKGVLYRSSSPVNNEICRAAYADALTQEAGVKTVINLADDEEALEYYFSQDDFNSPYYQELYSQGQVVLLKMGVFFGAPEFKEKLKSGLEFMIAHDGPYLIHCNEGKDRAGFVAGLLEALVGSSVQEIKEDYMVTYINYYGVEYGSEQYEVIAESNILDSLRSIAGLPKGADLTEVDLVEAAENYLLEIGLTVEQIQALKARLTTDITMVDAA